MGADIKGHRQLDEASPAYPKSVAHIFSQIMLGAGHIYREKFSEDFGQSTHLRGVMERSGRFARCRDEVSPRPTDPSLTRSARTVATIEPIVVNYLVAARAKCSCY
jgi:hypothetical protein